MKQQNSGQSLVEVLIAVVIGAILITAGVMLIVPSLKSNAQAAQVQIASSLGKQLLDNVRAWSEGNWNNVLALATGTSYRYYLSTASSPFTVATGTESITVATSTVATSSLTSGLAGEWNFDEGTGTVAYDSSGNGANGSYNGNSWSVGKIGLYSVSVGTSSYANNGSVTLGATLPSGSFTLAFWEKPNGFGSVCSGQCLVIAGESYLVNGFRSGFMSSNGIYHFWTSQSGGNISLAATTASIVGVWDFYTVTYAGGTASLFRDSIFQASSTGTYIQGSTNAAVDNGTGGVDWFWGSVDDVRIYNRALSQSEITQLYSLGQSQVTYNRYFYLSNVYRDSSGNVVTSGGTYDPSTEQVTVVYGWQGGPTNTMSTYVVRGKNNVFSQNDWSGGPGLGGPITSTNSQFASSSNIDYQTSTGSIYVSIPGY